MNKQQREKWHALKDELSKEASEQRINWGFILCNFCRFCKWYDDEPECHHPVERIAETVADLGLYGDCWAFRPRGAVKAEREQYLDAIGQKAELQADEKAWQAEHRAALLVGES